MTGVADRGVGIVGTGHVENPFARKARQAGSLGLEGDPAQRDVIQPAIAVSAANVRVDAREPDLVRRPDTRVTMKVRRRSSSASA